MLRLLRRNRDTRFGREHGFAAIRSYADFAAAVPVQTYETLRPYIEDQERTGEPALNAERPVMYARTSGTTGEAKLIPILRETIRQHKRSQAIQSYVQFSADARAYYGRFLAIVSPAEEGTLASGTPYGSTSGFMYENMPAIAKTKYVLPYQVFGIADYDLKYLLILRLAVTHEDVTHIACANPSTLVKLLSVLDVSRSALLHDITRGTFSRADELSAEVRAVVGPRLSCTPKRVAELRTILGSPRPTFGALWPELRLVSTWTGGSCRIPLASVRPALPPGARVVELGYLSSEFRGTLVADVERNAGTPTIHENFFEFVERDDWDGGRKVFRTIEQIEQGKEYYIVPTTGTGLYRYFMNDIVRVTGSFHATPTIEFVQKGKGVTNITGEKLYESQVIDAVRSTEDETGLASGFFLMLADANRQVYRLVVECATPTETWRTNTLGSIERKLGESNVEYAAKRASGRLQHLELLPVRPGTGDAYKRHCLRQGQREGQFKLIVLQYQSDCAFPFADFRVDVPRDRAT
ncbi:MAG: GH3 auxin-responsive promoter family protein [Acidobacteria bacterium]|nr:GH3 auxin-responsive promoter family protein [Acidobacteriota bacterium]